MARYDTTPRYSINLEDGRKLLVIHERLDGLPASTETESAAVPVYKLDGVTVDAQTAETAWSAQSKAITGGESLAIYLYHMASRLYAQRRSRALFGPGFDLAIASY